MKEGFRVAVIYSISSCSQPSACQEMKLSEATKNVAIIENFCCISLFAITQLIALEITKAEGYRRNHYIVDNEIAI